MPHSNGTTKTADTYGLTRDAKESQRLNMQHAVWKENVGFMLHPRVAAELPKDARIGDVGTGTGIWLLDLSTEQSSASHSYEGFDISAEQFPSDMPKSITLSVLNVLDPVPEHLLASFDVIHLRLLVLGLPPNTWELACKNLLSMLKPGGWLQWEEASFASMTVVQAQPSVSRVAGYQLVNNIVQDGIRRGQGWAEVTKLPSFVTSAGFAEVHTDVFSSDRVSSTRERFSQVGFAALQAIASVYRKMDGGSGYWASEESAKLMEEAGREIEGGKAYFRTDLQVVCAKKAV